MTGNRIKTELKEREAFLRNFTLYLTVTQLLSNSNANNVIELLKMKRIDKSFLPVINKIVGYLANYLINTALASVYERVAYTYIIKLGEAKISTPKGYKPASLSDY
jgi:hypothetical protein